MNTYNIQIRNFFVGRELPFWIVSASIAASLALYVFFINDIVKTVVARSANERSISSLNQNVESLESAYLSLKNGVTLDVAYAKGFTDLSVSKYITRKSLGRGLSLNNEI